MKSWNEVPVPTLPGNAPLPRMRDSATGALTPLEVDGVASVYVCGITPYDATHLGHAATYLAYDTLVRVLRDARARVDYVQNTTDVDDPLLERATATDVDWRELAESQLELYRTDMEALRILPPTHFVGVVESVDRIADAVATLREQGLAYEVESPDAAPDLYFDIAAAAEVSPWHLGQESGLDRETMLQLSAERGGDPDRPGKRDALDPLLWRAERDGEPAWDSAVGRGRPGWHIECSVIGLTHLAAPITLNGGGSDLLFPHHEFSAAHSAALTGTDWARVYSHAGMVGYRGEKMSKSLGNLVFVSRLREAGVDPAAIRLALLDGHYRSDREWTDAVLERAQQRLASWRAWAAGASGEDVSVLKNMRELLADDLDTAGVLTLLDAEVAAGRTPSRVTVEAIDALLGIRLSTAG
ncbi:cysteine--1-D-myo-inosityl 2-amino-2-deoxy-alpha-D-glucopyranoside ligase [Cryobacterium sp. BB307]|uniref:cysteine--1-D-myo-inosityl 2-amino-2-deoxy-alpha-D-glucopyranoside ligase n=1 Tax=Cryobacterium sp. BB307 TaxID=2716317 RepID=UPI0014478673